MKRMRLLAILLLFGALEARGLEIIAHRGASHDAPENTLPSIELGYEHGADAVEIDIYLTKDGRIVAIHDRDTARVAGTRLEVRRATLAELKELDVGRWKGAEWADTRIPTLDEVLEKVPAGKRLVIEIKCGAEVVPELERVLDASGKRASVSLIGFSFTVIREAKKRLPDIPAYWLYGFSAQEKALWGIVGLDTLIQRAKGAGLDGLDLNARGPFDKAFIDKLGEAGLKLLVYTVNDVTLARRLAEMGVAGITTDRPAWLRERLGD